MIEGNLRCRAVLMPKQSVCARVVLARLLTERMSEESSAQCLSSRVVPDFKLPIAIRETTFTIARSGKFGGTCQQFAHEW
jgi:hypothetical protein